MTLFDPCQTFWRGVYFFNPILFQSRSYWSDFCNPRLFHHRFLPILNPRPFILRPFNHELWGWKAQAWKSGVEAWVNKSGLKCLATLWVMSREISVDITLARCGSLINRKSKTTLGQIRHLVDTKKKKKSSYTGCSLLEELIFSSIEPKYDFSWIYQNRTCLKKYNKLC